MIERKNDSTILFFKRCNASYQSRFPPSKRDTFLVKKPVLTLSTEIAFKVKYTDPKGTEKIYDIKAQEGEKLLDSVKMAGIPIRCLFHVLFVICSHLQW